MELKIISTTDDMLDVWHISRPYVLEETKTTNSDLLKMNLPITQFKVLTIYFKSSILFRDLLFTFRPISEWARSNRTIKFNKDNIKLSDDASKLLSESELSELNDKLNSVIDRVTNGEKQDFVKKSLPLLTETEFCINVNYRTLINIVYTFERHFSKYGGILFKELCKSLITFKNDYEIAEKVDLYPEVALTEGESILLTEGVHSVGSTYVLKVNIKANLMAQFIRQHSSTIKNGLWNFVNDNKYSSIFKADCNIDVECVAIITQSRLRNLVSTRTCWFAQFDKSDNSSWSYIIGKFIESMNPKEFFLQLPCCGKSSNCKILKDMIPRIQHTEVNPPCPILLENPYIIDQRINQYKSDSVIMDKWRGCQKFIINNPSNKYNLIYGSINKEAGTNVK